MTVATVAPQPVEPPRDRYGRYLLPVPGTDKRVAHTRVTTIAGEIKDDFAINQWRDRMVAHGIGTRPDLAAKAASLDPANKDNNRNFRDLCEEAKTVAGASKGANAGTALHSFTQALDLGQQVTAPPPYDADVAAYDVAMRGAGIQIHPWWVERVLFHPNLSEPVAGTADRLLRVPGFDMPIIGDLKSGKFLSFPEIAIQLALYARAPYWFDPATDTYGPVEGVDPNRGLIVHLPAGSAQVQMWELDLSIGWEGVELALAARRHKKRKDIAKPFNPGGTP